MTLAWSSPSMDINPTRLLLGTVQLFPAVVTPPANLGAISGVQSWWDISDASKRTMSGANITLISDKVGTRNLTVAGAMPLATSPTGLSAADYGVSVASAAYRGSGVFTGDSLTAVLVFRLNTPRPDQRGMSMMWSGDGGDINSYASAAIFTTEGGHFPAGARGYGKLSGGGLSRADVADTNWHVAISVFKWGLHTMYLDGVAAHSTPDPRGNLTIDWIGLGCRPVSTPDIKFSGQIGEAAYFNRELTVTEIAQTSELMATKWIGAAAAPSAPTGLTATAGDRSVILSWAVPVTTGNRGSVSYFVEKSPNGTSSWTPVATVSTAGQAPLPVTSHTAWALTPNVIQYFRVSALNSFTYSTPSTVASATPYLPSVPAQVGTVTTTPLNGQVALAWSAPFNGGTPILDYIVQYRTTAGPGAWITFSDTVTDTTGTTVTGLTNATSYDFHVAAINSLGTGAYSNPVSATPAAPAGPAGIPNLVLWWDPSVAANRTMSGSNIVGLAANAGFGPTLVPQGAGPTLGSTNSLGTVELTQSSGQWLQGALGATLTASSWTFFQVYRCDDTVTFCRAFSLQSAASQDWNNVDSVALCSKETSKVPGLSRNSASVAPATTFVTAWHVVVTTCNAGAITIYVDGNQVGTGTVTSSAINATRVGYGGQGGAGGSDSWQGALAETGFYSRVLTSTERDFLTNYLLTRWFPPATVPGAPTGLSAGGANNQVALSWSAPASNGGSVISDYTVQYRTNAGPGAWNTFSHTASSATSQTVTGLTNNTTYDFQVAAVNSIGQGSYSATASATPTAVVTPSVIAAAASALGPGQVTVPKPAGGTTNDWYLVWYGTGGFGASPPVPTITGFTGEPAFRGSSTGQAIGIWFWRKYDGSEGSSFTVNINLAGNWAGGMCFLVRGLPGTWTPVIPAPVAIESVGTLTVPSRTMPANSTQIIAYKDYYASRPTSVCPASWIVACYNSAHTGYYQVFAAGGTAGPTVVTPSASAPIDIVSALYTA